MTEPRANDQRAKRLRARQRAKKLGCHICSGALGDIDYEADHLDPLAFQLDHKWQLDNGGPQHDEENCASSHRCCNRRRSNTVDDICIATAATYGVVLTPRDATTNGDPACAPDGYPCPECDGIHNPPNQPGVTFVTTRSWRTTTGRTSGERTAYVSSW
jgi:hypothetical protein